jgi:alpha-N-arabinofuranosidase
VVNVVNRHPDQTVNVDIELEDKRFAGPVRVSEVNGPDIKAQNDFDATNVRTVEHAVTGAGNKLQYAFPPHSFTMLKATVA